MWLGESSYPTRQTLAEVNELQWIQYILDLASTTEEAIQLASEIQVNKFFAAVHYMVCDTNQECASFEYLNKELVINRQRVPTLTNNTYRSSINYISSYSGFGGNRSVPNGLGSQARFVRASSIAANLNNSSILATERDAFSILDSVASGPGGLRTQWQIVYQPESNRVSFQIPSMRGIKTIDTSRLNYDCASSDGSILDLRGDVLDQVQRWKLVDYNKNVHHKKIFDAGNRSLRNAFSRNQTQRVYRQIHARRCVN